MLYHILVIGCWYAAMFGWSAHQKFIGKSIDRKHKEEWLFLNSLAYYLYSIFTFSIGDIYAATIFFIIGGVLNYALIEYFWNRYKNQISIIEHSLIFKLVKAVATSFVVSGSILYSGLILEDITHVPASYLTNYVAVFSIVLMVIFIPLLLTIALEISSLISLFAQGFSDNNKFENRMVLFPSIILFILPISLLGALAKENMLNTKFFNTVLYDMYHENSNKWCENISSNYRYLPISSTEASVIYHDKDKDTYNFYVDHCDNNANKTIQ